MSVAEGSPPQRLTGTRVTPGSNPIEEKVSAVSTYTPKAGDTTRSWYVIDATDVVLGRLAVAAANLLRGKHKPTFTPNVDGGDFVIVINADKVAISGDKLTEEDAPTATRVIPAVCERVRSVTRWKSTPTGSSRRRSSA